MTRSEYKLNMITGPDEMNVAGKAMGSHGAIGATYNLMCKSFVKMHAAFCEGDLDTATMLQHRCNRVIEALIEASGGKLLAAMKYLMRERLGLPAGCRAPCPTTWLLPWVQK
jgi:dihydrodipicolinate synthase/N-acetylneuraminate lyase